MEAPQMLTHVTPHDPRVTIIPRFRPEPGDTSDSTTRPPTKVMTQEMLLELMMVKRVEESPYKRTGPGPGLPVSIWEVEGDGIVRVRVEMPGAGLVVVYPNPNEMSINFKGVEEEIGMHGIYEEEDKICRVYEGTLYLNSSRFNSSEIIDFDYEFGFGVLFINIKCPNPATTEDLGVQLMTHNNELKESAYNPLVSQGKDRYSLHGFNTDDNSFVLAVDMPGIGEDDNQVVRVSQHTGTVSFLIEQKRTCPYAQSLGEQRKVYKGGFRVDFVEFDVGKMEFEISHGVMWLRLPRAEKITPDDDEDHCVTIVHGGGRKQHCKFN